MTDPLQALLDTALRNNQFAPTSRYAGVETAAHVQPDGTTAVYLRRRFVPPAAGFTTIQEHVVGDGERLDLIAARYLGDSEQFWRLCDANDAMRPEELVEPGRTIAIALPQGVPGAPHA